MRRIAFILILVAAVAGLHACAADAPTNPGPNPTPGPGTALQIQLVTSDANPKAGTCTLIQATVTLNGATVPDGTSVSFSTDFGAFGQNGLPLISVVTQNGVAVTALCGPGAGLAKVRASATVGGQSGSANLSIQFQPSSDTLPFVSSCSPSFGPKEGGTLLTLNGGRFFGSVGTTRVRFTVNGTTKDGVVQSISQNQIVVLTPGFPEFSAPQLQTQVQVSLGTNSPVPVVLSLPSCFSYGTQDSGTPTIASLLPAGGTSEGGTRVTIVGSGFSVASGVQVFFGNVEATVVSVSFNQVVALSPLQVGGPTPVQVTVRNIGSGVTSNGVTYTYTEPIIITAFNNNVQPLGGPFVPMTIFGRGFQAPVAVSLAGWAAIVQSVTATELIVIPGPAVPDGCDDITGDISVTNINTGSSGSGGSFTYTVLAPAIAGVSPNNSCSGGAPCTPNNGTGGGPATITGVNLPTSVATAQVRFGSRTAFVNSASDTSLSVTIPVTSDQFPTCNSGNAAGTPQLVSTVDVIVKDLETSCESTASQAFQYILPCVVPPTPTP
jgi:large repetitive protein